MTKNDDKPSKDQTPKPATKQGIQGTPENQMDEQEESNHLTRRTFVKWGTQAAIAVPAVGWATACNPPKPGTEPTTEPSSEPATEPKAEPGPIDGSVEETGPTEQTIDTKPQEDPQDKVVPGTYDKGKETTWAPDALPENKALFPLGVMSGAMKSDGALLWGYALDKKPKQIRVWRKSEQADKVFLVFEKQVTPSVDGYFHIPVTNLAPGTWYDYTFLEGSTKRSEIGHFKTALIEKSLKPLVIGATTCTNFRYMPYRSLQTMAEHDIDMLLHLGDMSYNDNAKTRGQFRTRWQYTLKDPGYRAILPKAGHYITWDDHEITNNDKLYSIPESQKRNGIEAFFESSIAERIKGDRFWQSYRWGNTAEIFVLDSRGERILKSPQQPNPLYISLEQMDWFKKSLSDSPCHFKLVLNSVPMIDWSDSAIGKVYENDRWQGYPKQRKEILDHIETNKIKNVWWLSGDFHVGTVAKLDPESPHSKMWEILVGPGANGPNPAWPFYKKGDQEKRETMFPPEQYKYFSGEFAATILTLDPAKDTIEVHFIHHTTKKTLFKQTLKYG